MRKFWYWVWPFLLTLLCIVVVLFDIWVNESYGKEDREQYGLGFVVGFLTCYVLAWINKRAKKSS